MNHKYIDGVTRHDTHIKRPNIRITVVKEVQKPIDQPTSKKRDLVYDLISLVYFIKQKILAIRFQWSVAFISILMVVSFAIGMYTVWNSGIGQAEKQDLQGQVLGVSTSIPLTYNSSELNVVADLPLLIEENRHEPTADELAQKHYEERKAKLKSYLQQKKSPFAKNDSTLDAFLQSDNMKLMLAISFVESGMGQHCYKSNCSGIGGSDIKEYSSHAAWIKDFDSLLERKYKGLPVEKFLGKYVQPGSANWLAGVKQVLGELKAQGIE
jgi:hypothetical protein